MEIYYACIAFLKIYSYLWAQKIKRQNAIYMKILVCISNVPDTTSKINFTDNNSRFDTTGVQFVINPNDEFGLTRAMWFKEKQGATVHVVTVGEAPSEPTIRKALAIGADEAIRIDAAPTDGYFVARQLVEVVKNGGYDLVIAGRESIDYNGGMVPGIMAAILDMNFVNTCINLEIDGDKVTAVREIDGGKETIETSLPLIIGGQKGLVEESDLRIPNMRGIMMARKKPLHVQPATDAPQATEDVEFSKPEPKGEVTLIDPDNIEKLVDLLHNEAKVI